MEKIKMILGKLFNQGTTSSVLIICLFTFVMQIVMIILFREARMAAVWLWLGICLGLSAWLLWGKKKI